jgi:hypothetical protein
MMRMIKIILYCFRTYLWVSLKYTYYLVLLLCPVFLSLSNVGFLEITIRFQYIIIFCDLMSFSYIDVTDGSMVLIRLKIQLPSEWQLEVLTSQWHSTCSLPSDWITRLLQQYLCTYLLINSTRIKWAGPVTRMSAEDECLQGFGGKAKRKNH